MRQIFVSCFVSFLCFFSVAQGKNFVSNDKFYKAALAKRLDFIFKDPKLSKTQLSIQVFSLSNQESLYEINADKALSPASVVKVLTAHVALKKLGPDFTFKTEVYTDGKIRAGVLQGNLYLVGGGDPALVSERMHMLVENLKRTGVKSVSGDIYVDDSVFDDDYFDKNRIDNDKDRAYNAPVNGLSFNYNTTSLYFQPGARVASKARVYVSPDTGYIRVNNRGKTTAKKSAYTLTASRKQGKGYDLISLNKGIPLHLGEQVRHFSVTQPAIYAGYAFRHFLEQQGIPVKGRKIERKKLPKKGRSRLLSFKSLPLREIVIRMNKFSNNFMADTLVKVLGKEVKGAPGTMEKGLAVLNEESTLMGINNKGYVVVSGSGLTRKNRMSARHFVKVLNESYLEFDVLPELLSSLPIAAKDGTLRRRMNDTSAEGKLRAKTGTIFGVSSLSGIVQSKGGELLAFAVLMNDNSQVPGSLRPWQNFLGQALADFNRKVDYTAGVKADNRVTVNSR